MKTKWLAGWAAVLGMATAQADDALLRSGDGERERNHGFYVGFGYGPTEFTPDGNQREVSGIDFTFNTSGNDLGGMAYAGYWFSDHVGLEVGGRDYGQVDVPFSFSDPHDNTSGTGESKISMGGFNVSLQLGFDLVKDVQLVARVGALSWKEKYKSRFDLPGEPPMNREMETSGTGATYGAGIVYRFTPGWQLEARYERTALDEDGLSLLSFGLSYDFSSMVR